MSDDGVSDDDGVTDGDEVIDEDGVPEKEDVTDCVGVREGRGKQWYWKSSTAINSVGAVTPILNRNSDEEQTAE